MNFLLHRHVALEETGSRAVAFGAMLPDLARLVDRRWRPPNDDARSDEGSSALAAIRAGITHHLEADAWFHRTRVFREGEKRTAAALRAAAGDGPDAAPRLGLFGHVTWEMCLDGAWLRRGGDAAARLAELRDDVVLFRDAASGLLQHGSAGQDVAHVARVEALWTRLADLAAGYADGEGVARRLDGIRRSLGLPPADDETRRTWSAALETCLADADDALPKLEGERHDHRASSSAASRPAAAS